MRSIKVFLFIVLLALICLGNFVAALNGYRASLHRAEVLLDQQLAESADLLDRLLKRRISVADDLLPVNQLFQIWHDKQPLYYSSNAPLPPLIDSGTGYHFASYNGYRWRLLIVEPGSGYRILIAQRYDIYVQLIEDILLESIVPILWIIPVLALLIWLIVSSGLRPLNHLASLLLVRKTTDFSRIAEDEFPDELATVVGSINKLMARLREAFTRESRFSSDAAHELRTPLTALKLSIHNLRADIQPLQVSRYDETLLGMQESVNKMAYTIEQLLALYRLTTEAFLRGVRDCNLADIVRQQIIESYDGVINKGQSIALEGEEPIIRGDEFGLSILLRNLIDNASKYSPEGSAIRITLETQKSPQSGAKAQAFIVVEDAGPGVPEGDYQRVFDRFYRQGGDRHASQVSGSGLGLSIVQHVVQLHDGHIELGRSQSLGGLLVRVRLPMQQQEVS